MAWATFTFIGSRRLRFPFDAPRLSLNRLVAVLPGNDLPVVNIVEVFPRSNGKPDGDCIRSRAVLVAHPFAGIFVNVIVADLMRVVDGSRAFPNLTMLRLQHQTVFGNLILGVAGHHVWQWIHPGPG